MNAHLSWQPPALNTDGSPVTGVVTYNLLHMIDGVPQPLVTGIQGTYITSKNLSVDFKHCFYVSATVNGQIGAFTEPVCKWIS
jgi:hypothetical protein